MELEKLKQQMSDDIDARAAELIEISHSIHEHPEEAFEEVHAHEVLVGALQKAGVDVTPSAYDMQTAFEATAGSTGPTIAVFCEYDALPGIGHACGHNIIATAGLGAGLAAAATADLAGGRVVILGSPAEEGGGGKVVMAEKNALDGVDAAVMVHPAEADLTTIDAIAVHQLFARYRGKAAHAAAAPDRGRNALDAAVLGYVNVAALRQHIRPDERVHGIFTKAGERPNIVPEEAEAHWYVRSPSVAGLEALKERVVACLEAGAAAAGCEIEIDWPMPPYFNMLPNQAMVDLYVENARALGREVVAPAGVVRVVGSTDMGNISHLVPSIHPMIAVSSPDVQIHSVDFARFAGGPEGERAVVDGAKALAFTIADLWLRPDRLEAAKAEFAAATAGP